MIRAWFTIALFLGCLQLGAEIVARQEAPTSNQQQTDCPHKITARHLPNPIQVHPRVVSGGLPEDRAAFQELQQLGIKTIISVDGATPDVALAKQFGLRYVHLPHGYDGISESRIRELAKAIRTLEGPFYVHCHHGKHRSPVAAGVACVGAGLIPSAQVPAILQLAGTSPKYRGLYETARRAIVFDAEQLDRMEVEFQAIIEVPPLAQAMVELQTTYDHLLEIAAAGWTTPPGHPDLDPTHEALLLKEHFRELLRNNHVLEQPKEFQRLLKVSEGAAGDLEIALLNRDSGKSFPRTLLDKHLRRTTVHCNVCHEQFRDVPLNEKQSPLNQVQLRKSP